MSRSRQRAHEPQRILGFEFCKIPCARRYCKVPSLRLRIKRVLVRFGPCNIGDPARTEPKKLFIEEEPPGVAKDK